jgi:guanylate kinase
MSGKLIIVSAPSGAGKTSIVKHLLKVQPNLAFSISATSRAKREGESDGKDYYFLTVDDFKQKLANDEFLEWQEVYHNQFYGTLKSEIERIWGEGKHVIFDVDVLGGLNLKKIFGDKALAVFIQPPTVEALKERLHGRGTEDAASLKKRLDKAEYELSFADQFDTVIVNDKLKTAQEEAVEKVKAFLG